MKKACTPRGQNKDFCFTSSEFSVNLTQSLERTPCKKYFAKEVSGVIPLLAKFLVIKLILC